jgi:hypothetical protein
LVKGGWAPTAQPHPLDLEQREYDIKCNLIIWKEKLKK